MATIAKFLIWGALSIGFVYSLPYLNHEMKKVLYKRMKKGFTPLPTFSERAIKKRS